MLQAGRARGAWSDGAGCSWRGSDGLEQGGFLRDADGMGVYADGGLGIPNFFDCWAIFWDGVWDVGQVLGPDADSSGFFGPGGPNGPKEASFGPTQNSEKRDF